MRKATMLAAGLLAAACSGGDPGAAAASGAAGEAGQFADAPAAGTQADRRPAAALPPGAVMMRKIEIMDPGGFARPMVAATALIPVGWRERDVRHADSLRAINMGYTNVLWYRGGIEAWKLAGQQTQQQGRQQPPQQPAQRPSPY